MKNLIVLVLALTISSAALAKDGKDSLATAKVTVVAPGKVELAIAKTNRVAVIKMRDEKGYLIYNNKHSLKKGIVQAFDISELASGKYKLIVEVDGQDFEKVLVVERASTEKSVHVY